MPAQTMEKWEEITLERKVEETLNVLRNKKKPAVYLYMAVLTILITYFASRIYKSSDLIWPRERYIIVATMTISFYMVLLKLFLDKRMPLEKAAAIYHFVLFTPMILMIIPIDCYELRPLYLIPMLVVIVSDLALGLITGVSVIVATYVMIFTNVAEFMYISLIIMMFGCFAASRIHRWKQYLALSALFCMVSFYLCGLYRYFALDVQYDTFQIRFALLGFVMAAAVSVVLFVVKYWIFFVRIRMFASEKSIPMKDMKEKSLPLYYHSVEVAGLAREAAKEIGADIALSYAGGLLHDIGEMEGLEGVKGSLRLANEYGVPHNIKAIMVECSGVYRKPASKEAAIVMLADSVVSAIEGLRNAKKDVQEVRVIESVFAARVNKGSLSNCGLDLEELYQIQHVFLRKYQN